MLFEVTLLSYYLLLLTHYQTVNTVMDDFLHIFFFSKLCILVDL